MEMTEYGVTVSFPIREPTEINEARRSIARRAEDLSFTAEEVSRISLIIAELGTNLVKHAGPDGGVLYGQFFPGGAPSVQMFSIDRGEGIADVSFALRDGNSSTSTGGAGLGAIRRASDRFDLHSVFRRASSSRVSKRAVPGTREPGGTVVFGEVFSSVRSRSVSADAFSAVGGFNANCPGETVSGDGWGFAADETGRSSSLYLCDGLGHGPSAATVAREADSAFRESANRTPNEILERMHERLKPTRGGAVLVCRVVAAPGGAPVGATNESHASVEATGVGNIVGAIHAGEKLTHLVSLNGIVGAGVLHARPFGGSMPPKSLLVLYSDGLSTRVSLADYPGIRNRHPAVIAATLYRDFERGRDDATVVVLRDSPWRPEARA